MWAIYATNRRLENPNNKFKAKKILVSYLKKLPLQELINTGKKVNLLHEQDQEIFDGLLEQKNDAELVSFLENKERRLGTNKAPRGLGPQPWPPGPQNLF